MRLRGRSGGGSSWPPQAEIIGAVVVVVVVAGDPVEFASIGAAKKGCGATGVVAGVGRVAAVMFMRQFLFVLNL